MGTTADKLNAVLASKNAIKTKFGLADDLPFSKYADNIESGTDVSATTASAADVLEGKQFYNSEGTLTQGTLVQSTSYTLPLYKVLDTATACINVTGAGIDAVNGQYYPSTIDVDTGEITRWLRRDYYGSVGDTYMIEKSTSDTYAGYWVFKQWSDYSIPYAGNATAEFPWEVTQWGSELSDSDTAPTVSNIPDVVSHVQVHAFTADYELDETVTKWRKYPLKTFKCENEITPVIGGIYDLTYDISVAQVGADIKSPVLIEFYKCASVTEAIEGDGYIVSGAGDAHLNGSYNNWDSSLGWRNMYGAFFLQESDGTWVLYNQGWEKRYKTTGTDLFTSDWVEVNSGEAKDLTVLPAGTPASWSGYKAYLVEDTENDEKYYNFEETPTYGLTYGNGYIPEVDSIYDADALIKAELTVNLTLDPWQKLSNRIQNGEFTEANLGEIIEVSNTALTDVGLVEGTIQFEVVAIDNADLVDTTKQHNITLFAKKVLFAKQWDSGSHNKWSNSQLRTYLQNEFFNCLDSKFSLHIMQTNRTHLLYGGGEETVQDTVFLPSYTEIGLGQNQSVSEGVQWNTMTSNTARRRDMNGQYYYWLSSASGIDPNSVWTVESNGSIVNHCRSSLGVVPALVFA